MIRLPDFWRGDGKGGPVALFVDIIGMPPTSVSYAGVARRTAYRRAVYWRR